MKEELKQKLYSERDASDFFGWSIFTMREIRKRGEIEYMIFNDKTIRYTQEQLENYKNEHLARGTEKSEITNQTNNK